MTLTIFRYKNRKLYIPRQINISLRDIIKTGRYTTLSEIGKLVSGNKELLIKVQNAEGVDITKDVLLNCLNSNLFTLRDLYNLVREQSLKQSVLSNPLLETTIYKSGTEL